MPPVDYRDFQRSRRSDRAFRNLMVATAASLVGVIVGGVSMFAVVSALTAPSPHDQQAQAGPRDTAAIAPIVTAVPQAASAESSPSAADPPGSASTKAREQTPPPVTQSVQPQTAAPTQSTASTGASESTGASQTAAAPPHAQGVAPRQALKTWPDALSRAPHRAAIEAPRLGQPKPDQSTQSRTASPEVADQKVETTGSDQINKRADESKGPEAGFRDPHAGARSSAAQRSAAQSQTGKRRTATRPAATEPAPGYDNTAALPPDRTRRFFDFSSDEDFRDRGAAFGPDISPPGGWNSQRPQASPGAANRTSDPRSAHRRRPEETNLSDQAPPPSGRGRVMVPAQPGDDDRGMTDFLGQRGDEWSEPTWHH
jgi:hypothetical protein